MRRALILWALATLPSCASAVGDDAGARHGSLAGARQPGGGPSEEVRAASSPVSSSREGVDALLDEEESTTTTAAPAASDPTTAGEKNAWQPPEPISDGFDWILLTSGEWLKGEIKVLRQKTLEFDSDKLDDLEIKWEDVRELRSPRANMVVFEDRVQASGTVLVRDDAVFVRGEEVQQFARGDLVSIVSGETREADYWSGKVSVGATFRSGNTNQTDVTARATLWRRTALNRLTLDYTGSVSTIDHREKVNNH